MLQNEENFLRKILKDKTLRANHEKYLEKLCLNSFCENKSSAKAKNYRQAGNEYFSKKKYDLALESYNKCILNAPDTKEDHAELTLGYSNRSAALFYLEKYQECLSDIELALSLECVDNIKQKLFTRKALCITKLTDEVPGKLSNSIERYNIPNLSFGSNKYMPGASSALSMKASDTKGRYIIANSCLKAGDVLFVEKPFAAILLPDFYNTHCHHCFRSLIIPFPCVKCSTVRYCSLSCRQTSWEKYHSVECRCLQLLHSVGIAHLAVRIILKEGLKNLIGNTYSEEYQPVFRLVSHANEMSAEDILQYGQTAVLLARCLLKLGWFNNINVADQANKEVQGKAIDEVNEECNNTLLCVCKLLLLHICQLICNGHAITSLTTSTNQGLVEGFRESRIATAIYPTASLMNHACDPTIINSFSDDTLIVKAIKNVEIGEEVFNCYGPHWRRMPLTDRRQLLQEQYFFLCHCNACTNQWQLNDKAILCTSCSNPINSSRCCCGQIVSNQQLAFLTQADDLFSCGVQLFECNNMKGSLSKFIECWQLRKQNLYKENMSLGEVCDFIAKCYASEGKYNLCLPYLKQSVQITAVNYGDHSIEYAHELLKIAEIHLEMKEFPFALDHAKRAQEIFEMHYGLHNNILKRINLIVQVCLQQLQ